VPPNPVPEHTWLTISELAGLLHITERHVRRLVAENRIPYTKVGGRLRFKGLLTLAWVALWIRCHSDRVLRRWVEFADGPLLARVEQIRL
jgi:excisionase family DNA binding protein